MLQIMIKIFKNNGLEAVKCDIGIDFDPNLHNAMFEVPTADVQAGKIASIVKQGYTLKGRVIRAADVGIARAMDD
jgi:molecular chaperone GrpE